MKLFRAVSMNEFVKLAMGEVIKPLTQRARACNYKNERGEFVKASIKNIDVICTFEENIWFYTYYRREILLELEIPENLIVTTGYGEYNSMVWNPFVFGKEGTFIEGEFGLKRGFRDGIVQKIKEVYISSYSIENIEKVYFLDNELVSDDTIINFDGFELIDSFMVKYIRKTVNRKYCLDYDYYCEKIQNYSFFKTKVLIEKELKKNNLNLSEFISKWEIYNGCKILDKALVKNTLKTAFDRNIEPYNVYYCLNEVFNESYVILKNLFEINEKPETFISFVNEFKKDFEETYNSNPEISEKFIYSMMKYAKII